MNHPKPTIKVVQYMHGDFEYFHWSETINRRYCERHGYEYARRGDAPRPDRHVNLVVRMGLPFICEKTVAISTTST